MPDTTESSLNMGRIRTIKPEFPHSESIGRLSRDARLLFIELWTIVDDAGRHRASSRLLASLLFPYDEDAADLIDGWLAELEAENCIARYMVDGSVYLQICNFLKHQKIDHPTQSRLPEFTESSRILANPQLKLAPDLVSSTSTSTSTKNKIKPLAAKKTAAVDSRFKIFVEDLDRYWKQLPNHDGKPLPMDASAGNNLKKWLKNNPQVNEETFWKWLNNMFISADINPSWNIREIISRVHRYADGPLDRYGKPLEMGKTACN